MPFKDSFMIPKPIVIIRILYNVTLH
uniref:Uncharacterized protein n=1 Tax=Arundo donax TaxID=35708 RepID=A0A0A8Z6M0_ARUDO